MKTQDISKLDEASLRELAHLRLAALGEDYPGASDAAGVAPATVPLLEQFCEQERLLIDHQAPADLRIQKFLDSYLGEPGMMAAHLPPTTLVLDRPGLARILSLPHDKDIFESPILKSYRVKQGVLHNPANDRRTTAGVFHVAEGGLPIQADKTAVPKKVFAALLAEALNPPDEHMILPYTSTLEKPAKLWVSLLLRPVVVPAVPGFTRERTSEIRFFAPGGLISNVDFVEGIFGNAGNPLLAANDAALDPLHWTGHTGCIILAPHLIHVRKKDLGLPHVSEATARQKAQGVCWEKEDECYNNGSAFKITARDARGVMVTIIADNYYGYCKKEVKTQISFSANLHGLSEEEHAGGAIARPTYDLGEDFDDSRTNTGGHTLEEVRKNNPGLMDIQSEGHGIDSLHPNIYYLPEGSRFSLDEQRVSWTFKGKPGSISIQPGIVYTLPSGYQVRMLQPYVGRRWRLVGTSAEGTFCHKPCTVSGGGKSEISKSIADAIIGGPIFVADYKKDFVALDEIFARDFSNRFADPAKRGTDKRPLLSQERTLGSVIKLMTPSADFTAEHNAWLAGIPPYLKELVFAIKRYYKSDWDGDWRSRFNVDIINGVPGNELKYRKQRLITQYLRIGYLNDGAWRTFGVRKDFFPAEKLQTEDDISASVVVPGHALKGLPSGSNPDGSFKFVDNCERLLFQRPDEAINRGYDKQTECDMAQPGCFISNYEPLTKAAARKMSEDVIRFSLFTKPMRDLIENFAKGTEFAPDYVVSSANPRLVDGKPSKNPRYLQTRQDIVKPEIRYLTDIAARLVRRLKAGEKVVFPVSSVLAGRRNNGPEKGVRPLSAYGAIHYFELPELFMDFITSMTGKSPSTTGAGSEGALTKGPFNAVPTVVDLNNALVSYLLTEHDGFVSSAGVVGPNVRVDHDVSLLIPELWSRMRPEERDAKWLIANGYLERCPDFEHNGKKYPGARLGYRVTQSFANHFFGRVFVNPDVVLSGQMLRPEEQSAEVYADSFDTILQTDEYVAKSFFEDGTIEGACPPLKALLHIMAYGHYEGKKIDDPVIRSLFTRESMLKSDWYKARIEMRRQVETGHLTRGIAYLKEFLDKPVYKRVAGNLEIKERLAEIEKEASRAKSEGYLHFLTGSLGTDPWFYSLKK